MIIIRLSGGLGNQMFQYAIYKKFQYLGKKTKIDDITKFVSFNTLSTAERKPELKNCFHIDYDSINVIERHIPKRNYFSLLVRLLTKVPGFYEAKSYDNNLFKFNNCYIYGYFQSEEWFKEPEIQKLLKQDFQIPKDYQKSNRFLELENLIKNSNSVSIHYRRTDYLNITNSPSFGGICTDKYYDDAINYICTNVDNPLFFVFSDDKAFVEEKYKDKNNVVIINTDGDLNDYDEFFLMSFCKHNIIANSTYSWWASWIYDNDDKIIVVPKPWYKNKPAYDQIYRSKMIRIDGQ